MKSRLVIVLVLGAVTAFAHHDPAEYYDLTKPFTLKGTVTDFIRANPHAFILIDVKAGNGTKQSWAVEGDAPNTLMANGWTSATLTRGDEISVAAFPARPGANLLKTLVVPAAPRELVALLSKVAERMRAQHAVHAAEVTLPNGRKLLFGHTGRYWGITRP
jgi:hypothetical protein